MKENKTKGGELFIVKYTTLKPRKCTLISGIIFYISLG
jgi:hypothetical protein